VHPLWFYKHQHDNRVRSKLFVACQRWLFQWRFAAILVNCAPSGDVHNYCTPHIIKENYENFLIHRCKYIPLSQVYCVWQVVKTTTIILNNPVYIKLIGNFKIPRRHKHMNGCVFWGVMPRSSLDTWHFYSNTHIHLPNQMAWHFRRKRQYG